MILKTWFIAQESHTIYIETGMVLDTANGWAQVSGRGRQDHIFLFSKQENPACFIFVDSFPTNTLQIHKCIKDSQI